MLETETAMVVGGLTPMTTIDLPGSLAAVVFCQGCPWRCAYCHNPHLLARRSRGAVAWAEVLAFLESRRGMLDGVVFSGGEPLLQTGLPSAMADVRARGYRIGLHTGGAHPDRLKRILDNVQWVGFDVKAPFAKYDEATGARRSGDAARASLAALVASDIEHEVRTTVYPPLLDADALLRLADDLAAMDVRHWILQECRPAGAGRWQAGGDRTPMDDSSLMACLAERVPAIDVRRAAPAGP